MKNSVYSHQLVIYKIIKNLCTNKILYGIFRILEEARWEYEYKRYREKYDIHPTFRFNGPGITLYGNGKIILGENSYIGRYSSIQSVDGCIVKIGNNCAISHYVMIYTANAVADQDFNKPRDQRKIKKGNVIIEDFCWIGAQTFITEGVNIGQNAAVVGANSVVTKDIPPHSIAVGCPTKVIKFKSYLNDKDIIKLAKDYWNILHQNLKKHLLTQYEELNNLGD
ncbi:Acetyltransferase (isoleucine patch superfamily)-like protein [Methanococcus aeolicus Nankai-3]|uniref:Acetyltransferase (Isoleucine patch superfamily)-like protein n=1 Tax=Methanococcus aeolicus (strain ATCC BAA-1280 / DSM 17508 / OCM 812 / Nankai-3) TaxID=419665 RepID=A6UU32_META3|nr:acyltransferase [Methanococcus aeolicus]ABR56004.1 Acetyltransferase (isoleucine patch superfamily)-like protein [Methanococcus aeolicus Nankai-3]